MHGSAEGYDDAGAGALRRYAPLVYGPTALYSIGQGAVLPLLPALAAARGADLATAALVAAALVVGQLCGNIPAGWLVSRIGERRTMLVAAAGSLAGVAALLLARHVVPLTAAVFVVGLFASSFAVARHTFMTTRVPFAFRARALSLVGGSFRIGTFTGPFAAAALLALFGTETASAWFFAACLVGVGLLVGLGPDPEERIAPGPSAAVVRDDARTAAGEDTGEPTTPVALPDRAGMLRTLRRHGRVLSRLGTAAAGLSALRSARQAVLPLWGVSLGLDASTIALVMGVAGGVELSLFYASGQIMDRLGRAWAIVPPLLLMAVAFLALSLTHDLDTAVTWFAVLACVIGMGNGLSSGTLLTLGSDVAPRDDPGPFLGVWRTLTDAGGAALPLIVSGVVAVSSLPVAAAVVGAVGLAGAGAFLRWLPRYVPRPPDRGAG